ncbi:hypothetical protein OG948_29945 [Embleya sp. NBC_00888]|uniref:hypothetical protein n=1 Tax=Embleya sp. NBC_00888 TaxID=2975960 RepID=UPI003865C2D0|nr:hypothetical protein OG948_29945 [Embleya sp. NBC_00888]
MPGVTAVTLVLVVALVAFAATMPRMASGLAVPVGAFVRGMPRMRLAPRVLLVTATLARSFAARVCVSSVPLNPPALHAASLLARHRLPLYTP